MTNFNLEKMYDQMRPGWDRDEYEPQTYTIYALTDTTKHDTVTLAGRPFACHLCGATNKWVLDNEHVFVCEHEPVSIGRGAIRQISSVATKLVGRAEVSE